MKGFLGLIILFVAASSSPANNSGDIQDRPKKRWFHPLPHIVNIEQEREMTPTDRSNEEQVPFVNRSSTSFFPPQLSTSESEKSESTIPQRVGRKLFILFGIPITIVLLIIGIMELLGLYGRHNDMHNLFAPRIQFQRNGDANEVDENIPLIDFEA